MDTFQEDWVRGQATVSRRRWLQAALTTTLAASLGAGSGGARAAGGYKALVCVFLYGGNDGLNTVVPMDERYDDYATIRKGVALPKAGLLPLDNVPFGLHPSLVNLRSAWAAGRMAAVFNVGPLMRPFVSKADYLAEVQAHSKAIPPSLFSHSDQQRLWQAADGEVFSRSGWGGRAGTTLGGLRPAMSLGNNAHFVKSLTAPPLVLPKPGSDFLIPEVQNAKWEHQIKRYTAYQVMYAQRAYPSELMDRFAAQQRDAMSLSDALAPTLKVVPGTMDPNDPLRTAFASVTQSDGKTFKSALASQLFQAAKLIQLGQSQSQGSQVFFVEAGGYDTHADQLKRHAILLKELDEALGAFDQAMQGTGLGNAVTVFTESDFGRTLVPNNSGGTDHAWGNHHLVLGAAVQGGMTYGSYPSLQLGGADDVGQHSWEYQGRWIPSTSVDTYAATLLKWLGLSAGQLTTVLPNLGAFAVKNLGFMRVE